MPAITLKFRHTHVKQPFRAQGIKEKDLRVFYCVGLNLFCFFALLVVTN